MESIINYSRISLQTTLKIYRDKKRITGVGEKQNFHIETNIGKGFRIPFAAYLCFIVMGFNQMKLNGVITVLKYMMHQYQ